MGIRKRRRDDQGFSLSIREGTAGDLEDLLAEAAASGQPGTWVGGGLAQLGVQDGDKVDPAMMRDLFLHGTTPDEPASTAAAPGQHKPPAAGQPAPHAAADRSAREVLEQIMARRDPREWRHGSWLERETSADDQAILDRLDPWLGYPRGGHAMVDLPGWDERSIWGFSPRDDCYFAQLWRNRGDEDSPDEPDIWINGWDTVDGRPYVVTTTHLLAREIVAATGCDLAAVCTALGTYPPS